ncbi:MAG: ion transporter [Flavobacterium sp. MedPE-SWcel]|uniref:ion transporter n=1 Tax=uncultured Flavobacterium sp. TaxID=165435 RepID=UPI0009147FFC|nr:ion transporter [uncultured Flavobacterium sp.]OIQ16875.1 MAG: ion transporter [Flavobacterium sp. MedPE-SWcel]
MSENFRKKLHEIIYEADTPAGKLFDVVLLIVILISVITVMLESVSSIEKVYGEQLNVIEWIVTIFFTIEYFLRIISVKRTINYIFSFYGIIDLLSTLPKYIDILFPGLGFLISIRSLRLLRVFRILKLMHFVGASNQLLAALIKSRVKIAVFLFSVIILCVIMGTLMYIVEGSENGFTNIPVSIYWTIVTLTTVGFGDIIPVTPLGQFISSVIMILGYGIIAVPTGLVTAQFMKENVQESTQVCRVCNADYHKDSAKYCYKCGNNLD